jgi:hypothetical protein
LRETHFPWDYAFHKPGLGFYPQMTQRIADKKKNLRESAKSADTFVKDIIPTFRFCLRRAEPTLPP